MPTRVACFTCGRHPQKCICMPRCTPTVCSICDVLGCCPYYHRDDVLEVEDAVRFARVVLGDGTRAGREQVLARFIIAKHGGES